MPETKAEATKRARKRGFPKSSVTKAPGTTHYYIAPHGVTSKHDKQMYAACRESGTSAGICSATVHKYQKKHKKK